MEQRTGIEIAATPERVWAVLSDVERWSTWTDTVTSVRRVDEGPLQVGSRAVMTQPRIPVAEYEVTELLEGRSFTWVSRSPGVTTTARHVLKPISGGTTGVTLSVEQRGVLGVTVGRLYRRLTDRYLAAEAAGLKARCESGT